MFGNALMIFLYAIIVFIGGIIGYTKGSQVSLIAGSFFGIALLISSIAIYKRTVIGYFSAIALSLTLLLFFTYRFIGSYKMMPAGMMILISSIVAIILSLPKTRKALYR